MKNDSEIRNDLARNSNLLRQLTEEESKILKETLLAMYLDVKRACDANGLKPMLCGGSALGAVRHKGFIPWDDDLDVMLVREEYDKFIDICRQGELGIKYEFTYPSENRVCKNLFMKIYLKGTEDVELNDLDSPFPKGIYLDIFPIENVPAPGLKQKIKGFVSDSLAYTAISVVYWKYRNKHYTKFMTSGDRVTRMRFWIRTLFGLSASIIPLKTWINLFDHFVQQRKKTGFLGIPTGRKHYCGEILPENMFLPARECEFEGETVYIPNDVDGYLKNLYGDYMRIPPIEKRERHLICRFKAPEKI